MLQEDFLKDKYKKIYGEAHNIHISFCPYRVCPLGAHSDHQHGIVTGFAINYGIYIAYTINDNSLCKCISYNYSGSKSFKVDETLEKQHDWADYIRGAVSALQHNDITLKYGITCYIYGEIPTGGLSSSAAVIISFIKALEFANDFKLDSQKLIDVAFDAETKFVGMNIGKLDQSCEVLSKKGKLLVLDTATNEYETVAMEKPSKPFELLVIHSGAERTLASTSFNLRVDEMRSAAFVTLSYENANKNKFNETYLRDVPFDIYCKHRDKLPRNVRLRAEHFYTEMDRVQKGKNLWRKGDIEEFGKLVSLSGASSINNYESGSPLLIDLYNIIISTDGVYGGRFLGGGFNGACMALINPELECETLKQIKNKYVTLHPKYSDKIRMYICSLEDGVNSETK